MGLFTRKKAQLIFDTEAVIDLTRDSYLIGRPANEKEEDEYDKVGKAGVKIVGNKIVIDAAHPTFSRIQGQLTWNKEKGTYIYKNLSNRGIININGKQVNGFHEFKSNDRVDLGNRHFIYI